MSVTQQTKNYAIFASPGTFMNEISRKEVEAWNVKLAVEMSDDIVERHGAKPYAFWFETYSEPGKIRDAQGIEYEVAPKLLGKSGKHYLNGKLRTLNNVRDDRIYNEKILLSNMEFNDGWEIICETNNGYKYHGIFSEKDVVVNHKGDVTERGDAPEWVIYRKKQKELRNARFAS